MSPKPPGGRGGGKPPRGGSRGPKARGSAPDAPSDGRQRIYGRNPVAEAQRGRRKVLRVFASESVAPDFPGAKVVQGQELDELAGTEAHQGVVAEVTAYPYADAGRFFYAPDPLIVALDEITDPQNLGAIARTAECAGATGVVVPERRSAEVTAAVCKASAGAVEHLPVARVRNLADYLAEAKEAGLWVYGAAGEAKTAYDAVDWTGGVVLVLGAEGKCLRPRVADACDDLVALPMRGRIGSLNVSAAAAVLLYGVLQSRQSP